MCHNTQLQVIMLVQMQVVLTCNANSKTSTRIAMHTCAFLSVFQDGGEVMLQLRLMLAFVFAVFTCEINTKVKRKSQVTGNGN